MAKLDFYVYGIRVTRHHEKWMKVVKARKGVEESGMARKGKVSGGLPTRDLHSACLKISRLKG